MKTSVTQSEKNSKEQKERGWQDIGQKGKKDPTPFLYPDLGGQHLLGLGDGFARVQALGAGPCAVENGVAPVDAHAVVEGGLALGGALVTRVNQPAVRLEQNGGT